MVLHRLVYRAPVERVPTDFEAAFRCVLDRHQIVDAFGQKMANVDDREERRHVETEDSQRVACEATAFETWQRAPLDRH